MNAMGRRVWMNRMGRKVWTNETSVDEANECVKEMSMDEGNSMDKEWVREWMKEMSMNDENKCRWKRWVSVWGVYECEQRI